jgi:glucose/arabinose dehydrogenase
MKNTIEMKKLVVFIVPVLLLTCTFSGCFGEEDSEEKKKGFTWPERVETECQISNDSGLICDYYAGVNSTPVLTLDDPNSDAIWLVDLDGKITKWETQEGQALPVQTNTIGDLSSVVSRCHFEQGLLGVEFDEQYLDTGRILLIYNENNTCESAKDSNVVLSHAKIVNGQLDMESLEVLIEVNKSNRNHNGGSIISIGDNRYIWSIGDGGGSLDPQGNGQNASTPLGTIQMVHYENQSLIPVNGTDNLSYTLHHGLRNPWRIDVDPENNLWIADVGQYCYEEVNFVPLMQSSNFGWAKREGFHDVDEERGCYENRSEPNPEFTDPVIQYSNNETHCSIIGGPWMDWGPQNLRDGYLYGDFCSGQIWIAKDVDGNLTAVEVGNVGTMIVGFGKGINDELLIFSWAGGIYQLNEIHSSSDLP